MTNIFYITTNFFNDRDLLKRILYYEIHIVDSLFLFFWVQSVRVYIFHGLGQV